MLQKLCAWLLYKRMGWLKEITQDQPDKYIICFAPHTSNWDFVIGQLFAVAEGMKSNFLMKKEWFFWPLGLLFRHIGGIPVDRNRKTSLTDTLAQTAKECDRFSLCVSPEGTRSRNAEWKKGFYYIAYKAGLPILLYALDYERKLISCTKTVVPSGDFDKDMKEIKLYYKNVKGKHPELFTIGDLG